MAISEIELAQDTMSSSIEHNIFRHKKILRRENFLKLFLLFILFIFLSSDLAIKLER